MCIFVYISVEPRGQCQCLPQSFPTLLLETGSLFEHGGHRLKPTQKTPGILLSLPTALGSHMLLHLHFDMGSGDQM